MELPRITICPLTADVFNETALWSYMRTNVAGISNETIREFAAFMLAGSGFQGNGTTSFLIKPHFIVDSAPRPKPVVLMSRVKRDLPYFIQ